MPFSALTNLLLGATLVFSKTLEDHMEHLNTVFSTFDRLRITMKGAKTYLGYPSIVLLGQRVNVFGMSTTEERIAVIRDLSFPETS